MSAAARAAVLLVVAAVGVLGGCTPSAGVEKGRPAPNFVGTTLAGTTLDLAALRGHPVVINFWGPSCVPCREEMPLLAAKATEHAADGLVIVGVLKNDPVELARTFAAQFGGTWDTVIDPGGAIKDTYRVIGWPQSFFVDADGILRSIQIGALTDADFERQLELTIRPS